MPFLGNIPIVNSQNLAQRVQIQYQIPKSDIIYNYLNNPESSLKNTGQPIQPPPQLSNPVLTCYWNAEERSITIEDMPSKGFQAYIKDENGDGIAEFAKIIMLNESKKILNTKYQELRKPKKQDIPGIVWETSNTLKLDNYPVPKAVCYMVDMDSDGNPDKFNIEFPNDLIQSLKGYYQTIINEGLNKGNKQ